VLKKCHINRLSIYMVIIFAVFLSFYAADASAFEASAFEAAAFEAKTLSDLEMEEIYGGYGGNIPFLGVEFGTMVMTAEGTGTAISGGGYSIYDGEITNVYPLASGLIDLDISDNMGLTFTNVTLGNNNLSYICNYINIELTNIHVDNIGKLNMFMTGGLH